MTSGGPAAFVREHAGLAAVPFVPELRIYQAEDAIGLWEETEARHGGPGLAPPFWAFPWAGGQGLLERVAGYDVPVVRDLEDADVRQATVWRLPPRA